MKNKDYHSRTEYVSKSLLDFIHKSPAHYKAYVDGEKKKKTKAKITGSLIHSLVFEQDNWAILPEGNKNSNKWKEDYSKFLEEHGDKELHVSNAQLEEAQAIRDAVLAHPIAKKLIQSEGISEVSIFKEMHGVKCKCRIDRLNTKHNVIVDLKTTTDSSPKEFAKSVWNYRYHVQDAFYLDMTGAERFFFIAVEKEPPYNVEVYELDEDAIERGREEYINDIEIYKKCLETNTWPGYTEEQEIHILRLPSWAK